MDIKDEAVLRLTRPRLLDAARLLGRAFWSDPWEAYLFPDESERTIMEEKFFNIVLRYSMMCGEVYTTSSFKGVIAWHFYGDKRGRAVDGEADPRRRLRATIGDGPFERLMSAVPPLIESQKCIMPEPHCYLQFLGVEPGQQGKGYGGQLITPVLKYADERGLPCYLETMREENILFYDKHGFKLAQARQLPNEGPFTWHLVRKPMKQS